MLDPRAVLAMDSLFKEFRDSSKKLFNEYKNAGPKAPKHLNDLFYYKSAR